ncbi:hypothetical protein SAMN06297387_11462 [Streptomyces zhaozhouensis]|uniref:DUF2264 domain-containing protein n=1 Tax=Streptomyces zhaozhouensis TaxID=1300267 RepID=A0A286DZJ4_9ACTN|nr:DUF2264 domain-containing protein [Streptomyces zhaozhouensis]SOD64082.1 hypothetical protein SAMN06297387_11462 [Streptomyces zhaozhouensis]
MNHAPRDPASPSSPLTGMDRGHWEETADRLLGALAPFAVHGGAGYRLPGPASGSGPASDALEAYARTFLLAAFRAAHAPARHAERLLAPYAAGLAHGADPGAPGRWPHPAELPQARVEAAALVVALHESRGRLWERLDDRARGHAVDWLTGVAEAPVPRNNWLWFRAVVAAFLRSVGAPHSASDIAEAVERTEEWYAGDGWYSDGSRVPGRHRNFDHYNGWAMHLFPLWYCRISGAAAEPGLLDRYRERLRLHLADAVHLIGGDGAPLFQGRSLIYRFATAAPLFAGALFDATPLAPGLTRRAASGTLRSFLERGAVDERGLLPAGWHGRFDALRQSYSGPGSPYWASQGFSGLLLPPDHAVWTETEERLPVERGDFTRTVGPPGWLVSGTAADGVIRVVNHGTDHTPPDRPARDDPSYARLAYSTHAGPDLGPPDPWHDDPEAGFRDGDVRADQGPDNRVALVDAEGRLSHRSPLRRREVLAPAAVSEHVPHWPVAGVTDRERWPAGPPLVTASLVNGAWEVRVVEVAGDDRLVSVGGHALAAPAPPSGGATARARWLTREDGLTSALAALTEAPAALTEHREEGRNAFGAHSATPVYRATGPLHAVGVFLGVHREPDPPVPPRVLLSPGRATVEWPDGTSDTVRWRSPVPSP